MKIDICIILLVYPIHIFSKNNHKIKQINSLLDSAYLKAIQFDLHSSISYSKKILYLHKRENYSKGIAWGYFRISKCFTELISEYYTNENKHLSDLTLDFEIKRVRNHIYGSSYSIAIKECTKALNIIPNLNKQKKSLY